MKGDRKVNKYKRAVLRFVDLERRLAAKMEKLKPLQRRVEIARSEKNQAYAALSGGEMARAQRELARDYPGRDLR